MRILVFLVLVNSLTWTLLLGVSYSMEKKWVGKKLPKIEISNFFQGRPFSPLATARGQSWLLIMADPTTATFRRSFLPLIERLHKRQPKLVMLLLTKAYKKELESALKKLPRPLPCYVARDRRLKSFFILGQELSPYFYIVGSDGVVQWEGLASMELEKQVASLRQAEGRVPAFGVPKKLGPGVKVLTTLQKRAAKALTRNGTTLERVKFIIPFLLGNKVPVQKELLPLWHLLIEELAKHESKSKKALAANSLRTARLRLVKARQEFAGFPRAKILDELWLQVARRESEKWLDRADKARDSGDVTRANKALNLVLKYYSETQWGVIARKRLVSKKAE